MKKCMISLLISVILGFFLNCIHIDLSVMETTFTVAGILFSVGMSLIVTMNTQDVRNQDAKRIIHEQNTRLLKFYITFFIVQTIFFVLIVIFKDESNTYIENLTFHLSDYIFSFNISVSFLLFSFFCITYYIWNMIETRNQIYEIEKIVEEERLNE